MTSPQLTSQHHHDRDRRATGRVLGVGVAIAALLLTSVACSGNEPSRNAASPASAAPSSQAPASSSAPAPPSTPKPAKPKPQAPDAAPKPGGGAPAPPVDPAAAKARKYAQAYAEAINAQDTQKMVSLVCDLTKVEKATYIRYFNKQFEGGKAKVTLVGPTKTKGNLAQTRAKSVATKNGERGAKALTITMQQQGEKWCIPSRG